MAHPEQTAFCQFVKRKHPEYFDQVRVLDIGALNSNRSNRSNRSLFAAARYFGVDVAPGRNVDIVPPAHLRQLPDDTFDVIISTGCFEHDQHLAESLRDMYRMLRPGGLFLFTTAGRPELGTRRTAHADAPLPQDMEGFAALFSEYDFSTNDITGELYFYGIKPGSRADACATSEASPLIEELRGRLAEAEAQNRVLSQALTEQEHVAACLRAMLKSHKGELALLRMSTSWKVTRPLRIVRRAALKGWRGLAADAAGALRRVRARPLAEATGPARPRAFTILSPPHTEYVANCLAHVLREERFQVRIESDYDPRADRGQHYLVLCPQIYGALPRSYYAFQMEQTVSPRWFTEAYLARLSAARAVLDYSRDNLAFFQRLDVPYQHLFYVPILPTRDYPQRLVGEFGYRPFAPVERTRGVVFYGDTGSPRRQEMFKALRRHCDVRIVSNLFGRELIEVLRSARVIVNIHYYEGALLETTRLSEVLSLGVPVVSEEAANRTEYDEFRPVVEFVPLGDTTALVAAVRRLLDDEAVASERRAAIQAYLRTTPGLDDLFRRFLFVEGLIPTSSLMTRTHLEGSDATPAGGIPSYCLTLSETVERRRAFVAKQRPEYRLFEGLRHRRPWIGCGLSYKYLLGRLVQRHPLVLVCEDDVVFPYDFDRRWRTIRSHLLRHQGQWDVFVGLIADVHADAQVLDVTQQGGETYVTLDRMTSTVFNLYSAKAMALISQWDERNVDQQTNTIDRYLERAGSLRVVTTLPYLVDHGEDHPSTLWNVEKGFYRAMIATSQQRLQEKVRAFQAGS
ncbi:MAG TPA: methyltransferase domain-containing protein [Pseudomonadota bacterium]|nr:methyltransferase domain-containing protein [Pseudomonadota bacterium]